MDGQVCKDKAQVDWDENQTPPCHPCTHEYILLEQEDIVQGSNRLRSVCLGDQGGYRCQARGFDTLCQLRICSQEG